MLLGTICIGGDRHRKGYSTVPWKSLSQLWVYGDTLGSGFDAVTCSFLILWGWCSRSKSFGSWATCTWWLSTSTHQVTHTRPQILYHITAWKCSLWSWNNKDHKHKPTKCPWDLHIAQNRCCYESALFPFHHL